jgi:hypothetical protein
MKRLALVLLLISGAAFAQPPAPAQEASAPPEPETVYSLGEYIDDYYQASRSVNGLLFPADGTFYPHGQYSRWRQPVCFNVYGLAPAAKYVVERRMKEIAAQIGAPVDRDDPCVPNVSVLVTPDPAATLQSIAEVRPWLVPCVGMIRSRVKETLPVQAWYAGMIVGAYGQKTVVNPCDDGGGSFFETGFSSHLHSGFATEIGAVTILVNTQAIMGLPLRALADHFALLSLAEARQGRGCKAVESVANLMAGDCDPALVAKEITSNDLTLLTSLYGTTDDRLQMLHHVRIIGKMRRTLEAQRRAEKEK